MKKQASFFHKLSSNPLIQTIVFYVSTAWILLEMSNFLVENYELSERMLDILLLVLVCGFPVTLTLVWYFSKRARHKTGKKHSSKKSNTGANQIHKKIKGSTKWWLISGFILILLVLSGGFRLIFQKVKSGWATSTAIPEIERLWNNNEYTAAFEIFTNTRKYIRDEQVISDLESYLIQKISIVTEPPGAKISIKEYTDRENNWHVLGTTPLNDLEMPYRVFYKCRFEKDGYEPVMAVFSTSQETFSRKLFKIDAIPPGMVHVNGLMEDPYANQLDETKDFFIDKYEVTNKQYKEFMNNKGYINRDYWKQEFSHNGDTISREEAMRMFVDKSGRPGPAEWVAGTYPEGKDNFPVNGISWYEAAAYAEYAGKELPTLMHWYSAMCKNIYHFNRSFPAFLVPLSNMDEGSIVEVGSTEGIGCYGNYDMAGNVREWCWNQTRDGRLTMGGAWDDYHYMYITQGQALLFDRSTKNGFRCVLNLNRNALDEAIFGPVPTVYKRDFLSEEPVSDEVFNIYRNQFLYDKKDLNPLIESRDETPEDWILEKISFDAAYENERMYAWLYLPKEGKPPFQTVVFFPGDNALLYPSFTETSYSSARITHLARNKIAVLHPVYYETYERCQSRNDSLDNPKENHTYTEHLVKWVKDLSRSLDYLETREDLDNTKIAYFGWSWGGLMGAIIPAVEERLKLIMLMVPGMYSYNKALPEADVINYITRVKQPVLMLNGRYDHVFAYEIDIHPMYQLFGTPEEDKVLKLYETGHYVPQTQIIKETLNWLEKYWGPPD